MYVEYTEYTISMYTKDFKPSLDYKHLMGFLSATSTIFMFSINVDCLRWAETSKGRDIRLFFDKKCTQREGTKPSNRLEESGGIILRMPIWGSVTSWPSLSSWAGPDLEFQSGHWGLTTWSWRERSSFGRYTHHQKHKLWPIFQSLIQPSIADQNRGVLSLVSSSGSNGCQKQNQMRVKMTFHHSMTSPGLTHSWPLLIPWEEKPCHCFCCHCLCISISFHQGNQ